MLNNVQLTSTVAGAGHVEYLRQVRGALVSHGRVMALRRALWRILSQRPSNLAPVLTILQRMELASKAADDSFNVLVERYPNAPALMRAYGRFLEQVRLRKGVHLFVEYAVQWEMLTLWLLWQSLLVYA